MAVWKATALSVRESRGYSKDCKPHIMKKQPLSKQQKIIRVAYVVVGLVLMYLFLTQEELGGFNTLRRLFMKLLRG